MWDEMGRLQGRMMSEVAYYFIFLINSVCINYECFMFLIHCNASLLHFSCSLEYMCYLFKLKRYLHATNFTHFRVQFCEFGIRMQLCN